MQCFIGHLTSRFIIHMVAWEWCIFQVMQEVCSHPSSHSENMVHRPEENRLSDCRLSMIISNQFLQDSWRQGSKAVDDMCHWNHHFLGHPAKLQLGMGRGQTDQGLQRWMELHIWEPRFPPLQESCGEAPGLQSSRGHCQPGGRDWSIPKKKKIGWPCPTNHAHQNIKNPGLVQDLAAIPPGQKFCNQKYPKILPLRSDALEVNILSTVSMRPRISCPSPNSGASTSASFHHRWHWDQSSHSGSASCGHELNEIKQQMKSTNCIQN